MSDSITRLPIKVIIPEERDFYSPAASGGDRKVFGTPDSSTRENLANQLEQVNTFYASKFEIFPQAPAVARITLKKEALAKSHRPYSILNKRTCPVFGIDEIGDLLVSVQPNRLERLSDVIRHIRTNNGLADISTIERISPYTFSDVIGNDDVNILLKDIRQDQSPLKLRVFNHNDTLLDSNLLSALQSQIDELNISFPKKIYYAKGINIYELSEFTPEVVLQVADFVGSQHLSIFPRYQALRSESIQLRSAVQDDCPVPDENIDYPIVGLIDSGINPANNLLSRWVISKESYVPKGATNFDHGSFVAGLLIHPKNLNGSDPRFPDSPVKIVDITAIPENDTIYEHELLTILEDSLKKYPNVRVWNFSIASPNKPCENFTFSDFAIALDDLQDQYGVVFIIACGNYSDPPLRGWPPPNLGEADRLLSPADSIRGIAVGSVAHLSKPNSCVIEEQPSPFTRRGPGPVFLPKPELTHYGGNCDLNGNYLQTGMISFNGNGDLAENIGTSFSTPLVTSLVANVSNALVEVPSRNLTKALTIHSARLVSKEILTTDDLRYRGFGVPQKLDSILTCEPWQVTLVFEIELLPGVAFEKTPFPIPNCLRGPNNSINGEIVITAVYDPPLDPSFGSEYCRRNVEVSLGTYDVNSKGDRVHKKQIPIEPRDINQRYEKHLIEHGFKWSPVKVYRRNMKRTSGDQWRLLIKLLDRKEYSSDKTQKVAILITLLDPKRQKPVYDEVLRWMNLEGWVTLDLQIKDRIQIKA